MGRASLKICVISKQNATLKVVNINFFTMSKNPSESPSSQTFDNIKIPKTDTDSGFNDQGPESTIEFKRFDLITYAIDTVDRDNCEAHTEIVLDPRWESVKLDINFDTTEVPQDIGFFDDHRRGIAGNFKDSKGRPGGRDDRVFFFKRPPEIEAEKKRLEALLKEKKAERTKLAETYKLPRQIPDHIEPVMIEVPDYGHHQTERDDEGKIILGKRQPRYTIHWYALGEGETFESRSDDNQIATQGISDNPSFHGLSEDEAKKIIKVFRETGEMSDTLRKLWGEFKKGLEQRVKDFNDNGGLKLSHEIVKITKELDQYNATPTIDVVVRLRLSDK